MNHPFLHHQKHTWKRRDTSLHSCHSVYGPTVYLFSISTFLKPQFSHSDFHFLAVAVVVMGALDYVSNFCECSSFRQGRRLHKLRKHKQLQTVEIKVKMDCEGCEKRVRKSVEGMKGATQVEVDPKKSKLTVIGYVEPHKVLQRVKHRTGKRPVMWPYVPYDEIPHPYAPGVYDRKAPPGYVRNAFQDPQVSTLARASSAEVKYTTAFSDDNPNACVVM